MLLRKANHFGYGLYIYNIGALQPNGMAIWVHGWRGISQYVYSKRKNNGWHRERPCDKLVMITIITNTSLLELIMSHQQCCDKWRATCWNWHSLLVSHERHGQIHRRSNMVPKRASTVEQLPATCDIIAAVSLYMFSEWPIACIIEGQPTNYIFCNVQWSPSMQADVVVFGSDRQCSP